MSDKKKRAATGAIEEEETFVRGGGSGLAPIVKKQLEQVGSLIHVLYMATVSCNPHACPLLSRMPIAAQCYWEAGVALVATTQGLRFERTSAEGFRLLPASGGHHLRQPPPALPPRTH